jgi:hypothetical protein
MNIRRSIHLVSPLDRAISGQRLLDERRDLLFTAGLRLQRLEHEGMWRASRLLRKSGDPGLERASTLSVVVLIIGNTKVTPIREPRPQPGEAAW